MKKKMIRYFIDITLDEHPEAENEAEALKKVDFAIKNGLYAVEIYDTEEV